MKPILTIAILIFMGQSALAQKQTSWTVIDTLELFSESTLVEYKTYIDSNLNEHAQAFLFPIEQEWPKYRILKNLFKTTIQLDSIVFHGNRTTFIDNQFYKTERFEQGTLISTKYFDSKNTEVSKSEFEKSHINIGPCGNIRGHYFYHGKKK
jgi:hypothetical protein